MSHRLPAALLAVIMFLVGCANPQHSGGYLHPNPPKSVVSLSPSASELLGVNLPLGVLKGRTASCNFPGNVLEIDVVGDVKPNYEKIAALKPDLVVVDRSLYSDQEVEKLKDLKLDVLVMDVQTVDQFQGFLELLGSRIDQPMKLSEYNDKIYSIRKVARSSPPNPKPKVAILLTGNGYMIAGRNSFYADCVRSAGGEPVGPESKRFEKANIEALIAWNPDIIVVGASPEKMVTDTTGMYDDAPTEADAVLQDARLKPIAAIRNGRVAAINQDILLRAGGRVDRLINNLYQFFMAASKK
jgi:iron complex transport system substrate-binding protein